MHDAALLSSMASALDAARTSATAIAQWDGQAPLDLNDGYAIQQRQAVLRAARGERQTGVKLAFTSRAMMDRLGVAQPVCGRLFANMCIDDGACISMAGRIRPRAEPELAFLLARPLAADASEDEALAAIEGVAAAIEIVDSRYRDFRFSLADVVADNASASAYVIGAWRPPSIDFGDLAVDFDVDGRTVGSGSTAAILGHPLKALLAAARLAEQTGTALARGSVVMAGSACDPAALAAGARITARVRGLGQVGFTIA